MIEFDSAQASLHSSIRNYPEGRQRGLFSHIERSLSHLH